ncbi:MAG: NAD(P)-dependent oxidoreductase [Spirochaetales bacterium]|nr:MAG: NAD(P)-dependent oxidoreductase [Spirochaetales bacterium]
MRVLITGAYGFLGNLLYAHLARSPERYEPYGLVRRLTPSVRADSVSITEIPESNLRMAELSDFDAVRAAMDGIDVVVHLAADPDPRSGWEPILNSNVVGTYNVFESARAAGVKRVVFASTNQVVFGYSSVPPYDLLIREQFDDEALKDYEPIRHEWPTKPTTFYSCSKVFGEALAYMYSETHGMSSICLRIGWVLPEDKPRSRTVWSSQRDIVQMMERCIVAPDSLRFDVFFGQSDNEYNIVDIQHVRDVLGYEPQDGAPGASEEEQEPRRQ